MGVLIDASVLIAHERGALDLGEITKRIDGRDDEGLHLSVVTVSELLHGVHRAEDRTRRTRRSAWVEAVLDQFPVLPIDMPTARAHAEIWAGMAAAGTPVGAHDLWIAATAISRGLSLATTNLREFSRIPGLTVEDWSRDSLRRG